jgi:uncharacterized protein (UPF0332 family)
LSALLIQEGFFSKSHNGARTLFAEHFIKTGKFEKEAGLWLTYCFEIRQQSDYDFSSKIELPETERCIEYCQKFIEAVRLYL